MFRRHPHRLSKRDLPICARNLPLWLLILGGCTNPPPSPATATSALPDLAISDIYQSVPGCPQELGWAPFIYAVTIRNVGTATTFQIAVYDGERSTIREMDSLAPQTTTTLHFQHSSDLTVVLDPANQIIESDETNNSIFEQADTQALAAICSPPTPDQP